MPYKYDATGNLVTTEVEGKKLPVFVHPDGKEVHFDADGTLATISRLNGEAKAHREGKEALESAFRPFKDAGITDIEAAKKALQVVANLDGKKLIEAGEVDKVKAEAIKAVEEKYRPFVSKAEKLESQIASMLMTNSFRGSKFATEKFAAKGQAGADVAQALFGGRFKPEGDKLVGFDASGNKLFSRSRPGELADFDEALEMIVDAYPHKEHILASNGASGGGAGGSKGGAAAGNKTVTRAQFDAMGQGERMAFSKAGGVVTD